MKSVRFLFVVLTAISPAKFTLAQSPDQPAQGFDALRQAASSKTEFTLDHSMLVFASKLDQDNQDLRRVIAGINGVSVHSFRFRSEGMYDPGALGAVKDEFRTGGWKHLVNNREKNGGPGATDLWLRFDHDAISNIAILVARAKEVDLIEIAGSISPLDLMHLGGHFGIPKIEGGVEVPRHE